MNMLIAAATALSLSGAAFAGPGQDHDAHAHHHHHPADTAAVAADPNVIVRPPAGWSEPQLVLFREHMVYLPESWTAEQRANYRAQLGLPPIRWTPEQRLLYQQHMANLPPAWSAEQRAMYRSQIAGMQAPWTAGHEGMGGPDGDDRTTAEPVGTGPANDAVDTQGAGIIRDNQRGRDMDAPLIDEAGETGEPMAAAERWSAHADARPYADMRDWAGMGGPYEAVYGDGAVSLEQRPASEYYPPCNPNPSDDNCIQLYEQGVRR